MSYWSALKAELDATENLELKIDLLRMFPRARRAEIRNAWETQSWPLPTLFEELTHLAEAVLRGAVQISWSELMKDKSPSGSFVVLAMGKLGGREMTWHSDLDLIFLFQSIDDRALYTRLGQRVISALTLLTAQGSAYAVDTQLRPSGNAGTLVSSFDSFRDYFENIARTWERQAMIKARPLLIQNGNEDDLIAIREMIRKIVYRDYDIPKIKEEIRHLRMRMENEIAREQKGRYNLKTGRGGLVDIEFIVQFYQLRFGYSHPEIQSPTTLNALKSLKNLKLIDEGVANFLESAYLFYREREAHLRLAMERSTDEIREKDGWNELNEYLIRRDKVRSLFEGVFS